MFSNGDICRVELKGWRDEDPEKTDLDPLRPLNLKYNNRKWKLEVGKPTSIPSDAVMLWFGDPRAMENVRSVTDDNGIVSFIGDRMSEVRRLRVKYGGGTGDEANFDGCNVPIVEVFDLAGEPVTTVLNDPSGNSVFAANITQNQQTDTARMLAQLQRQVQFLTEQLSDKQEAQAEAGLLEPDVEADPDALPIDNGNPSLPQRKTVTIS